MKKKMLFVCSLLVLVLMAMAGRPEKAEARSSVSVGFNIGVPMVEYVEYPRYGYGYAPPRYYSGERWRRVPPPYPPRGWYRGYPPPPPVYHHRPRHHRHHDRGHDRW